MILVTTVWHSGTHSLLATFPNREKRLQDGDIIQCHCNQDAQAWINSGEVDEIVTTYRSPFRVAASWVNRGRLPKLPFQRDRTWRLQWEIWAEIVPAARVVCVDDLEHRENTHGDEYGLHAMLNAGDYGLFFAHVPRDVIQFAYDQVAGVLQYLPEIEGMTG